jgi:wyosine [tRNA(Phe)-imidazoG37] synthetase (radical SAM superfamily)
MSTTIYDESGILDIQTTTENRSAFHKYLKALLQSVLGICTLKNSDDEILKLDNISFKIRDFNGNIFQKQAVGEIKTYASVEQLLTEHVYILTRITTPQSATARPKEIFWEINGKHFRLPLYQFENCTDYIFSFNIPNNPQKKDIFKYFSSIIIAIFEIADVYMASGALFLPVQFIYQNKPYKLAFSSPDEILNLGNRTEIMNNFRPQPLHSISGTEPTILLLAFHWSALKNLLVFNNGQFDFLSFALNKNSDWVIPSSCSPSEIYEYLARMCNVTCKFCYLFGNPTGIAVARGKKIASDNEIETRLKYFNPTKGQSLFHAQWEINEFLLDPKLEKTLTTLRQKSKEPFFFITNGNPLTHKVMEILRKVKPVYLIISTNTLDAPLRSEVMGEKKANTRTALNCLEYLKKYKIPFGVSLIAFPDISFKNLTKTVKALSKVNPAFVRVNMPGFTQDHPVKFTHNTDRVWSDAVTWIKKIRKEVKFPVISIPSAYEFNVYDKTPNIPKITGVIENSPAEHSGLKPDDIVLQINGIPIEFRSDILSIISFLKDSAQLRIKRGEEVLDLTMELYHSGEYPYLGSIFGKYMFPYGIVLSPGISRGNITEIEKLIKEYDAKDVWLITSQIMLNSAQDFIEKLLPEYKNRIHFLLAQNNFLGGNIRIMDMCTIGDFKQCIEEELCIKKTKPELVIIPGTGFNKYGRDLSGKHWTDLERFYPFPVKILTSGSQFAF